MPNNSIICLFLLQAHSTFMATQSYIFYMYEEQSNTTCSLTVLGFFVTILLNFPQLKYQGINKTDPFQKHPKTMRVSVISLLIYVVNQRFSSHPIYRKFSELVHNVMVLFSSLSLASTASVLFPDPVSHVVFSKFMQHFEEESYFQRRRADEPVWNYVSRRMNIAYYPMEQRFYSPYVIQRNSRFVHFVP
ncbi:unnamed protein product [Withania somnifera]